MTIIEYRNSLGMTQSVFAEFLGLKSKGHVSGIESTNTCSAELALVLEEKSQGMVDASELSAVIAHARKRAA